MVWAILGNVYAMGSKNQFSAKSYTEFSQSIEKIASEPAKSNQEMAEDVVSMFDKYGEKGGSENETV